MICGIVGPRLSGKSTLFSILTGVEAPAEGGKRETQRGVAKLPDYRLQKMADVWQCTKLVYSTVEYVDIPGIASKKEGESPYPAQYLADLRAVDMLALVVRDFDNPVVPPPSGVVDPENDLIEASLEFVINDLDVIEKRLNRVSKLHDKESKAETELLEKCKAWLADEKPLRDLDLSKDDLKNLRGFSFLSMKPLLVVLNVGEENASEGNDKLVALQKAVSNLGAGVEWTAIAAGIEHEISTLDPEERKPFLEELGFDLPALDRVIKATFRLLGLSTFLTAGRKETRAWTIPANATALQAARVIHEDLARGFIRSEVYYWEDLLKAGSEVQLKKEGKMRLEGKDYVVQDGDVLTIRFNV